MSYVTFIFFVIILFFHKVLQLLFPPTDELDVVQKMKSLRITTLIAASLFLVGCVLPVPHRRIHSPGIEAAVIDAKTASPVTGAKISSPDGSRVLTAVDSRGRFKIPAKYGWHGAYMVGPISYSLLPHFDIPHPRPSFRIDAIGYQSMTVQPFDKMKPDERTGLVTIRLQPK